MSDQRIDDTRLDADCPRLSRREALRGLAAAGGALAFPWLPDRSEARGPDDPVEAGLIVRNPRPLDAESPVEVFDRWITPNDLLLRPEPLRRPAVGLVPWSLTIGGSVAKETTLSLDDLDGFDQVTLPRRPPVRR